MNTLPKSLTVAFLSVFIFISGLTVDFVGAQNTAGGPTTTRRPADPYSLSSDNVVQEVIERIAEYAPDPAENLRALVQNFQIERTS